MKEILILGAGKSSSSLIKYLIRCCSENGWFLRVGDASVDHWKEKITGCSFVSFFSFDIFNEAQSIDEIGRADLVVSMLPASYHIHVAKFCLQLNKHLFTASFINDDFRKLSDEVNRKGLLFMMECGLDPGLDHMTAMLEIDKIKEMGGKMLAFYSYTGGLIAPESDNNPWNYKFTWNPRNVVLAGQGTAKYIYNGKYKYVPYHRLFSRFQQVIVKGFGSFEGYPNRDSLSYREVYGLQNIPTLLRGTLRRPGFCSAWDIFVQLGMTDDGYAVENSDVLTFREYLDSFLPPDTQTNVEEKFCKYFMIDKATVIFKKMEWLGLFEKRQIGIKNASPAMILQKILENKLDLTSNDKDMIVMQHQFEYELLGVKKRKVCSLVSLGDNAVYTAMAKTVGLPLGIVVRLFMEGKLHKKGLCLPITPDIYRPVIQELTSLGINFREENE